MEILRNIQSLAYLDTLRGDKPLVLVPTMGALHEGHLSLVKLGAEIGPVVVSVFVNPTQFGPGEDFESYPRDLEGDLNLLRPLGVKAVFTPEVGEIYGGQDGVTVQPGFRAQGLCGGDRPGHFAGVLTVVAKLFNLFRCEVAIFGRKDAQQCLVIRQMVEDLKMPVRLIDGVTVREPDGLAMSSRNRYLSSDQRLRALCLSRALYLAEELLRSGERNPEVVVDAMRQVLVSADSPEYAGVWSVPDLGQSTEISGMTLLAVAARVGPARLIDNLVLDITNEGVFPGYLLGK